jgi:WhiB family redox-sensing transcriptional regulator
LTLDFLLFGGIAGRTPRNLGANVVSVKEISWRQLGACLGLEPSIFYPEDEEAAEEAKSVCAGCKVRVACLEHALSIREKQGVWGGATERERRRIIRQRRRTA